MKRLWTTLKDNWPQYILEIIVIILGILGAFALNNWNELRKDQQFEIRMLSEIYSNLQADSARLVEWIEPRIKEKLNGIDSVLYYIHNDIPSDWNHQRIFFNQMQRGMLISINSGPYEVLKSRGMEKIRNEHLRFWLIDLYESLIPRQITFIQETEDRWQPRIDDIKAEIMENYTWESNSGNYLVGLRPRSSDFWKNDQLLKLIQLESYIAQQNHSRTDTLKEAIRSTLELLRDYLNSLGVDPDSINRADNLGVRGMLSDSLNIRNR